MADVPLTFGGKSKFNIENILDAALAGYLSNLEINDIKIALHSFIPSLAKTPGPMNLLHFPASEVLVNYAHNVVGLKAVGEHNSGLDMTRKVGIVAGEADRRHEDFYEIGQVTGQVFDWVIVRLDAD